MSLLFAAAIVLAFWSVLEPSVVFVAPDAPLMACTLEEAMRQWSTLPLTVQGLVSLLPFGFSYEGTFWVDAWVMGLAGVFLLRGRGVSWGAAWVGGFCAAFAGYFFTLFCAGHRGVVDALAVTCFCFGTLLRAMQTLKWRWFVLLGIVLALGLGAQADIWFLVVCALGTYGVWLWVCECPCNAVGSFRCLRCGFATMRHRTRSLLMRFALTLFFFLVVGWPALWHTFGAARTTRADQLAEVSYGAATADEAEERQWHFVTNWSLPPEDLLELVVPGVYGHTSYAFDPKPYTGRMGSATQSFRQHTLHLGWLTLLLAAVACWGRRGDPTLRDRTFWLCLAAVTLLLALGRYTPFYRMVWALPFIDSIRAPVKWFHLTGFALAMLAGLGVERWVRRWGPGVAWICCALIALNGALVARAYVFPIDLAPEETVARLAPRTCVFAQTSHHGWLRAQGLRPTDQIPSPEGAMPEAALILQPDGHKGLRLILFPLKGGRP